MTTNAYVYPGSELDLFESATNWKRYWVDQIKPFLGDAVAEIGAGIGANTAFACHLSRHWTCIEPDPSLAARIEDRKASGTLGSHCTILNIRLAQLPPTVRFDTILYIDVLEHIEDDRAELAEAAAHLRQHGYLIVLSPAHQWLYTPFDAAIGHVRRYTRQSLTDLKPSGLRPLVVKYLDSVGLLASLANRLLLRTAHPTAAQIGVWDRVMIPASRWMDGLIGFRVGKSVLAIWQAG